MAGVELKYDQIVDQGIFDESSTQKYELGSFVDVGECRYRYCKGMEAITKGQLCSHYDSGVAALAAGSNDIKTAVIGAKTIVVRNGAVALDANKDWYLQIGNSTGEGELYKIKSNTAGAGTSSSSTLTLYDPIRVATTAGNSAGRIVPNKYTVQICNAANPVVEVPVCKAPIAVTANYFFWGQTKGPSAICTGTGGATLGGPLYPSTGATGKVRYPLTSSVNKSCFLGNALSAATSSTWCTADLKME